MKKALLYSFALVTFFLLFFSCSNRDDEVSVDAVEEFDYSGVSKIVFSDPVEIMSNTDLNSSCYDNRLINEYNIVKYKDFYFLYYIALGKSDIFKDANYNLCIVYTEMVLFGKEQNHLQKNQVIT